MSSPRCDLAHLVNPAPWPVPPLPGAVWHQPPGGDDGLQHAAEHDFGTPHILPVGGTAAATRLLPT